MLSELKSLPKAKAAFIEPMLLLRTEALPEGSNWLYELKLDGYRIDCDQKQGTGASHLRSRNDNDFSVKYPAIPKALALLPDETVIDGEVVALDGFGRPVVQHPPKLRLLHSADPVLRFRCARPGRPGCDGNAAERPARAGERGASLSKLGEPIPGSPELQASLADLVASVRAQGLEGLVAKRRDSRYEPGQRSGAWQKMRINKGQEFVIAGYTVGGTNFDALIFGCYDNGRLLYVARTRNGFTPRVREELLKRFRGLEITECPFANLPEARSGRWGQGLTAEKMAECRWIKPVLVGQFEFTEWTPDNHLRHSRFVALRDDKKPKDVRREG